MFDAETSSVNINTVSLGQTSSGKRMWRCYTDSDVPIQINIFENSTAHYQFISAGYNDFLSAMTDRDVITWHQNPIHAVVTKKGDWWEFLKVMPRERDAIPDDTSRIVIGSFFQRSATLQARALLTLGEQLVIWDVETTGLGQFDDIIAIGAVNGNGDQVFPQGNLFVRPTGAAVSHLQRDEVQQIHGLTYGFLEKFGDFREAYPEIRNVLYGKVWSVYNAGFDMTKLRSACLRYNCDPIIPAAYADAMIILNDSRRVSNEGKIQMMKLVEIAGMLGVTVDNAHDAHGDALTTYLCLRALAEIE